MIKARFTRHVAGKAKLFQARGKLYIACAQRAYAKNAGMKPEEKKEDADEAPYITHDMAAEFPTREFPEDTEEEYSYDYRKRHPVHNKFEGSKEEFEEKLKTTGNKH